MGDYELPVRIALAHQRPGWRRRLAGESAYHPDISDLRLLRAVERRAEPSIGDVAKEFGIDTRRPAAP